MQQFLFHHQAGNKLGVLQLAFRRAVHFILEVRRYPEQLGKLGIVFLQQHPGFAVPEQNNLHIQRHRFRLDGNRPGEGQFPLQGVDLKGTGAQRPLQAIPHEGLLQHLDGIHQQVTTVGLVQAAGANQREVGKHRALVGDVFHVTEQIVVGGVIFHHHGHFVAGLVHQHIYDVAAGCFLVQRRIGNGRLFFVVFQEDIQVFSQVFAHRFQVGRYVWQLFILVFQLVNLVAGDAFQGFLVQGLLFLGVFLLPVCQLAQNLPEFLLQLVDDFLELVPLLLGQGLEAFRRVGLFAVHSHQPVSAGGADGQAHFLALGLVGYFFEFVFLQLDVVVLQLLGALQKTVALEGLGNHLHQPGHQLFHVLLQLGALTRGQLQQLRITGLFEIGHVTPVMALLLGVYMVLQVAQHHGALAQPVPAYRIHVVTTVGHGQCEAHGFLGTVLADDLSQRLQLPGGFEWQLFQNTGFVELVQRQ